MREKGRKLTKHKELNLQSEKLKLIQWLSAVEDEAVIKQLVFLMKSYEEAPLSASQEASINARLDQDDQDALNYISWEEAKDRIRKKAQNAL